MLDLILWRVIAVGCWITVDLARTLIKSDTGRRVDPAEHLTILQTTAAEFVPVSRRRSGWASGSTGRIRRRFTDEPTSSRKIF
jgi:hypothetical protein